LTVLGTVVKQLTRLRVEAVLENVPLAIDCAGKSAREAGFDERTVHRIQMAVDEACANVVQHAYAGQEPGDMEVLCQVDDECLVIRVRDWGRAFDPDAVEEPKLQAPLAERDLGGLGLFLIRQFVDRAQFTFDPVLGNELTMEKRLPVAE
jgi:serine/threonine-protein kinase RsbW